MGRLELSGGEWRDVGARALNWFNLANPEKVHLFFVTITCMMEFETAFLKGKCNKI